MVMHARKPQRMGDGYFEKHQSHPYQSSKYNSKRDYERDLSNRPANYNRDETSGGTTLSNGNSSYHSNSTEADSPTKQENRERDRDRFGSYLQKMRERDRDVYKKDKYSDKRDRRGCERESEHRTNHDRNDRRPTKINASSSSGNVGGTGNSNDKRSGSDDRDRNDRGERNRDRERNDRGERNRDRERNDRGERIVRIGDWSEHVSSSGKMYYYNCKTEVSQWEKPKEWIEKERVAAKEPHRDYRDKDRDRDRDREDRFSRSSATYVKHSNSRDSSRLRWPYETTDIGTSAHRRRHDENTDMDVSPGDSTPTSETNYSVSSTPTAQINDNTIQSTNIPSSVSGVSTSTTSVLLANALPRLTSHPTMSVNSQIHSGSGSISGMSSSNSTSSCMPSIQSGSNNCYRKVDSIMHTTIPVLSPSSINVSTPSSIVNHHQHHHHQMQQQNLVNASDLHINSNAPGPPQGNVANLPKIMSHLSGNKQIDLIDSNLQKSTHTINNNLLRQQQSQSHHNLISGIGITTIAGTNLTSTVPVIGSGNDVTSNISRETSLSSPLYNLTHGHSMSPLNQTKNTMGANVSNTYSCNTPFGLKTVDCIQISGNSSNLVNPVVGGVEGPPTPTQELDLSTNNSDQRKLETTSTSISSLQSCVSSSQSNRPQGPDLSPKLAKYFRADLITHVTNWPADMLEKQAQKCSEEAHIYGDLQCTKVSAELKCARSLVRITEITATLQEQKIMYLRQQIRRLEELKSQNSFMSDDL